VRGSGIAKSDFKKYGGRENAVRTIVVIACVFSIVASAGADPLPSKPYVGVFADGEHSVASVSPALFSLFDIYVFFLPSEHGLMATEFRVIIPSNVYTSAVARNPLMPVLLGCPPPGESYLCALFGEGCCATDWVWTHHLTCLLTDAMPGVVEILPRRDGESVISAYTCEEGYPAEPVTILNALGINRDAVVAVELESWGAIKSLYR